MSTGAATACCPGPASSSRVEVQQCAGQPAQTVGLAVDFHQVAVTHAGIVRSPAEQSFAAQFDVSQRRAQLVAGVGDERSLLGKRLVYLGAP